MKKRNIFKAIVAAFFVLIAGTASLTMDAVVRYKHKIKVLGTDEKTALGVYDTSEVSYIEVTEEAVEVEEYPDAEVDVQGNILIKLTSSLSFKMIKVEGGVDYALRKAPGVWTTAQKTKRIETFYLGEFEVTQGVWKNIKGSLPTGGTQSKVADNCPVAYVSWDRIAGTASDTFLKLINAQLTKIKQNNPVVAAVLGSREFRLPSEWEWEYAAAGGKKWSSLNYNFSGTSSLTSTGLDKYAVNSVSTTQSSVAPVGSKLPNALGLYDMSGNVWELCSGLGYPGYETSPGYYNSSWDSYSRPYRGGSWRSTDISDFNITDRSSNHSSSISDYFGFRLAL